jgi:hypothetical protein
VLKLSKGVNQVKKPKEPKGDFPEAQKEVNYIYGGSESYESRRKQKLTAQEVMAVSPITPSTLNGQRSQLPSIPATTSSRMSSLTEFSSMEAAP